MPRRARRACLPAIVVFVSLVLMTVYFLEIKYHVLDQYRHLCKIGKEEQTLPELDSKYYSTNAGAFEKDWALSVTQHQQRKTSQGLQDGALAWIFYNIGTTNKYYVEFGFSIPSYVYFWFGIQGANTYQMYVRGWTGLLLDCCHWNPLINLQKLWITPSTIVQELTNRGVPHGADYISIDMDSNDCFTAREVACGLKPRVMTVEYNCNFPITSTLANMGEGYSWDSDRLYGCAFGAHVLLAQECGYTVVDVVKCLDVIFVRNDLLVNTSTHETGHWASQGGIPFHRSLVSLRLDKSEIGKHLCAFEIWQKTKDFKQCSGQTSIDAVDSQQILL